MSIFDKGVKVAHITDPPPPPTLFDQLHEKLHPYMGCRLTPRNKQAMQDIAQRFVDQIARYMDVQTPKVVIRVKYMEGAAHVSFDVLKPVDARLEYFLRRERIIE